jgi:phosphate transport system protein
MRTRFTEELEMLNHEMTEMGALCEDIISKAGNAMITGNMDIAESVKPRAAEIDGKEREVENLCLNLLLRQQPVAGDLRMISAALKMITDMQRIGDQAADIAEIAGYLKDSTSKIGDSRIGGTHVRDMALATIKMVNESIDAYVKQDVDIARQVIDYDDVVDGLFKEVKSELINLIVHHPEYGEYSMDLLMIAKYFERIGDHAVNIARWVVFAVTGER